MNALDKYKINIDADITKKQSYDRKMKEIIGLIDKNPKILKDLDVDKLELIYNYYNEQIAEYKKRIGNI